MSTVVGPDIAISQRLIRNELHPNGMLQFLDVYKCIFQTIIWYMGYFSERQYLNSFSAVLFKATDRSWIVIVVFTWEWVHSEIGIALCFGSLCINELFT